MQACIHMYTYRAAELCSAPGPSLPNRAVLSVTGPEMSERGARTLVHYSSLTVRGNAGLGVTGGANTCENTEKVTAPLMMMGNVYS